MHSFNNGTQSQTGNRSRPRRFGVIAASVLAALSLGVAPAFASDADFTDPPPPSERVAPRSNINSAAVKRGATYDGTTTAIAVTRSDTRDSSSKPRGDYATGSRFQLYSLAADGKAIGNIVNEDWGTCEIGEDDGNVCYFTVPNTFVGGNNAHSFWIVETDPVPGSPAALHTSLISTLSVGEATDHFPTQYQHRTPPLQANTVVSMPEKAERVSLDLNVKFSGNPLSWVAARANPIAQKRCPAGMRIAMAIDLSGSMVPHRDEVREAAQQFIEPLVGSDSSVALFSMGTQLAPYGYK